MPLKRSTLRTGLYAAPRSVGSTKKACLSLHAFCFSLDMLNEAKHPCWIPRYARNDTKARMTLLCHAERSAAKRSIHIALDSSLWLGMTQKLG